MRRNRTRARRGVLLLVILALLAMFAMIAVAFVLLTSQERRTALVAHKIDQVTDPPKQALEQAAMVVFRGTNGGSNPTSAVKSWSLMEKIHGNYLFKGKVVQVDAVCQGQLLQLTIAPLQSGGASLDGFRRVGSVLSAYTGPAAGLSTRIVGYDPSPNLANQAQGETIQVLPFEGNVVPSAGDEFIVNGPPFSGTGLGFGTNGSVLTPNPPLDGFTEQPSLALLPNRQENWEPAGGANSDYTAPDYQDMLLAFQIPSPWRAQDNAPVSNTVSDGTLVTPIPSLHRPELIRYFAWRVTSQAAGGQADSTDWEKIPPDLLRWIMLRPYGLMCRVDGSYSSNVPDHPNFTGSNPNFNPIWDGVSPRMDPATGKLHRDQWQWDVDNDNDGKTDSVWVDLGFPVRYTADGVAYKPLFAILCVDLDGRLNVNAHGTLAQSGLMRPTAPGAGEEPSLQYDPALCPADYRTIDANREFAVTPQPLGTADWASKLPRGQGYGPAEINLRPLMRLDPTNTTFYDNLYQTLLVGNTWLTGRYGEPREPGTASEPPRAYRYASLDTNDPKHGISAVWQNKRFQYAGSQEAFGSPPDPQGYGAIGLDRAGHPVGFSMGLPTLNNPYQIDLSRSASHGLVASKVAGDTTPSPPDGPYTPAELERVLRPFDRDTSGLPSRLCALTLLGSDSILQRNRHMVTGESWDVPCPGIVPQRVINVWWTALLSDPSFKDSSDPKKTFREKLAPYMLPPEIMAGLKMDLNRPFGNGLLDNADNPDEGRVKAGERIVDEPNSGNGTPELLSQWKYDATDPAWWKKPPTRYNAAVFKYHPYLENLPDTAPDGTSKDTPIDRLAARQLYARHLFVLMRLVSDWGALVTAMGGGAQGEQEAYRFIAQWAINVVAYRDNNSIMIPFNYDPNFPWGSGWTQDKKPEHTVWGCKRPELLLTEAVALHDRRTEDLDGFKNADGTTDNKKVEGGDSDFDQRYRPQASLFVELYNPWSRYPNEPRTPDLWTKTAQGDSVDLTRVIPDTAGAARGSPVWRLVIVPVDPATTAEPPDLDDPQGTPPTIERVVYFVSESQVKAVLKNHGTLTYYAGNGASAALAPGRYAVIGSAENASTASDRGALRTYLGFEKADCQKDDDATWDNTRCITLAQGDLEDGKFVAKINSRKEAPTDVNEARPAAGSVSEPVVVAIDSPRRLSVSDPPTARGYEELEEGKGVTFQGPNKRYKFENDTEGKKAIDVPLDKPRTDTVATYLRRDKTTSGCFIVYLQRLANPLIPWSPETPQNPTDVPNPYRTIDALPVDLTCFNGVCNATNEPGNEEVKLCSRQRGEEAKQVGETDIAPASTRKFANLWKQEPVKPTGGQPIDSGDIQENAGQDHYFKKFLRSSLGHLNHRCFGQPSAGSTPPGDPDQPFPWLHWAYRPLVSQYELLQVPVLRSSKLLVRHNAYRGYFAFPPADESGLSPYDAPLPTNPLTEANRTQYPHLLNFFQSGVGPGTANFYRLLDCVGVPSMFVGADMAIRPDVAAVTGTQPGHWFHPPFHRVPLYREPGRVNLNTIASNDVLQGLMDFFPGLADDANIATFATKFAESRRGKTAPDSFPGNYGPFSLPSLDDQNKKNAYVAPTRFARPFRTFCGAMLVPPEMKPSDPVVAAQNRETAFTVLRSDPGGGGDNRPLFQFEPPAAERKSYMDPRPNPYFRYQPIQRLGNLATTRSNVFAVWITVGYFQVQRTTREEVNASRPAGLPPMTQDEFNLVYPDGYQLGQELGIDTGEVERHRAFYIFDRSIPVGFMRGQDLNVDRAVLLRRFIE